MNNIAIVFIMVGIVVIGTLLISTSSFSTGRVYEKMIQIEAHEKQQEERP